MDYVLLTGATGLLGRYLMRDLIAAGVPLAVLVRRSRKKTPWARVEAAMRCWEELEGRSYDRPVVLEGDINQPDFGLAADQTKWAAENVGTIIHNAASLLFVSTGRHAEPWRSNVDGTRHVLEFCREAGIRRFFHVSTAYVAGLRSGKCCEHELRMGQAFANPYEESKVEAEEMVRSAPQLDQLTIFRPGIIIGDSRRALTFTYHNFYAIFELAYKLSQQMSEADFTGRRSSEYVRFNLKGTERKNLVPVDWVSAVMSHVVTHPALHGQTYHLTPRVQVTSRLMRDVIEQVSGLYGVTFYGAGEREPSHNAQLEMFYKHIEVYDSYWRDDPEFDSTNTQRAAPHLPCPHVDREMLVRAAEAALQNQFGWKDPVVEEVGPARVAVN